MNDSVEIETLRVRLRGTLSAKTQVPAMDALSRLRASGKNEIEADEQIPSLYVTK